MHKKRHGCNYDAVKDSEPCIAVTAVNRKDVSGTAANAGSYGTTVTSTGLIPRSMFLGSRPKKLQKLRHSSERNSRKQ